jgi:hypothetical protein
MPGPHFDGVEQVVVPFGVTFQPWALSRLIALDGL